MTAIIPQDQPTNNPAGIAGRHDGEAPIMGLGGPLASGLDLVGAVGEDNEGGNVKRCSKCGMLKKLSEFSANNQQGRPQKRSDCKKCAGKTIKKWRINNPEWRMHNPERERVRTLYYQAHKDKMRDSAIRSTKKIRSTPKGKLSHAVSSRIRRSLQGNKRGHGWETLVGYNVDELKKHLEKQFTAGMTWDNYGKWHIDHIIPVSAFNFNKPEDIDFKRCWSLKNIRPLWALENLKKHHKLSKPFQPCLTI